MMKYLFSLYFALLFSLNLRAQYVQEQPDSTSSNFPSFSIKYFPSHLIGHFPSHLFGAELMLNESLSLEGRYGRLIDRDVYDYDQTYYFNKSGFKSSLMLKLYMNKADLKKGAVASIFDSDGRDETFQPYLGVEFFYNQINHDRERTYKLSCGAACSYYSETVYGLTQNRWGGRFHLGFITPVAGPVFLDCSVGLGLMKWRVIADDRKPEDYEHQYGYNLEEDGGQSVIPAADLNIKVLFRIFR